MILTCPSKLTCATRNVDVNFLIPVFLSIFFEVEMPNKELKGCLDSNTLVLVFLFDLQPLTCYPVLWGEFLSNF